MTESGLFCTFYIGSHYYGVPVSDVQEVLAAHHITDMPLSPPAILGLMNIRGQIVPAISMRNVLRIDMEGSADNAMNVIVTHEGAEVSLVVDRIGDIFEVNASDIEATPETLRGVIRQFISGVLQQPNGLLLLLDIHAVLSDELCCQSFEKVTINTTLQ